MRGLPTTSQPGMQHRVAVHIGSMGDDMDGDTFHVILTAYQDIVDSRPTHVSDEGVATACAPRLIHGIARARRSRVTARRAGSSRSQDREREPTSR